MVARQVRGDGIQPCLERPPAPVATLAVSFATVASSTVHATLAVTSLEVPSEKSAVSPKLETLPSEAATTYPLRVTGGAGLVVVVVVIVVGVVVVAGALRVRTTMSVLSRVFSVLRVNRWGVAVFCFPKVVCEYFFWCLFFAVERERESV